MTRYLIDIYKIEIPENGERRDDISEATEDWLGKHGRTRCYQFQMQGNSLNEIGERLTKRPNAELSERRAKDYEKQK